MSEDYQLTEQEKQDYADCAKNIYNKIQEILIEDKRGDYSTRVSYIARSIAILQRSDLEMTQCLSFIIDAFTDEVENYKEFLESEKEKTNDSLNKFKNSVGKEVEFTNETRSIN